MKRSTSKYSLALLFVVAFLSCITLTISYSFVSKTKTTKNAVSITTNNLENVVFDYESYEENNTFILSKMNDADALVSEETLLATIDIENNSGAKVAYDILFSYDDDNESFLESSAIPLEYVKCAIYRNDSQITEPFILADSFIASDPIDIYKTQYILISSSIGNKEKYTYSIRLWIDSSYTGTESYVNYFDFNINKKYDNNYYAKNFIHNINKNGFDLTDGDLEDMVYTSNHVVISPYEDEVSTQNRLSAININYDNYNFIGAIQTNTIYSGENSVQTLVGNGVTGTLQKLAFDYRTTPYKILQFNNFPSGVTTKSISYTGNTPPTYIINNLYNDNPVNYVVYLNEIGNSDFGSIGVIIP